VCRGGPALRTLTTFAIIGRDLPTARYAVGR
jgi:hypothetical protein